MATPEIKRLSGDGYNLSGELIALIDRDARLIYQGETIEKAQQIIDLLITQNEDDPDLMEMQLARAFYLCAQFEENIDITYFDKIRIALNKLSLRTHHSYHSPHLELSTRYLIRVPKLDLVDGRSDLVPLTPLTFVLRQRSLPFWGHRDGIVSYLIHLDEIEHIFPFDPNEFKDRKDQFEFQKHQIGGHEIVLVHIILAPGRDKEAKSYFEGPFLIS